MRAVITGGAGFVGTHVALSFRARHPDAEIIAFDNLHRRGSELNLARLREHGVTFVHGDVRQPHDLEQLSGDFDVMVEASAEPSVHAGMQGDARRVLDINLGGTMACLEFCRRRVRDLVFLSSSRVYSIAPLRALRLRETPTRFDLEPEQAVPGVTASGIDEQFPVMEPRSFYGASKLASEILIQEYVAAAGLRGVINRCGVIAGPGQFGKVDQGVFTLWVARHHFRRGLSYTGFGGTGKQVRDLLHPADLTDLIHLQLARMADISGTTYNVGGGPGVSTSLAELTSVCREVTGNRVDMASVPETAAVDVPFYVSNTGKVHRELGWSPQRSVRAIVSDIHHWIVRHEQSLAPIFA